MSKSKILFCVSGSIAAFKAADVVSKLVQNQHTVQVIFSPSAGQFVGAATFEGLTGRPVLSDLFESGQAMAHIDLARWADLFVLCPASAQKIAELSLGFANDLINALFLAKEAHIPAVIFPAMNPVMWNHPAVQKNRELLATLPQVKVIPPQVGTMACGEVGEGRLPEPPKIIQEIELALPFSGEQKGTKSKVLVTGGGTTEDIDEVRSITNTSSGETSCFLADHLTRQGFEVDLLLAQSARFQPKVAHLKSRFRTHEDLEHQLQKCLSESWYDGIIHLAAVSDFRPKPLKGKISSDQKTITLELHRTPKLISHLREWSQNKKAQVIGFKLTVQENEKARKEISKSLLHQNDLDGVVSNDLTEIQSVSHSGFFMDKQDQTCVFSDKTNLAQILERFLEEKNDSLS